MAHVKGSRPQLGGGNDSVDYRAFARGFEDGSIRAEALDDATAPNGVQRVTVQIFVDDPQGSFERRGDGGVIIKARLEERSVNVPRRRLTRGLEWRERH